MKSLAAIILALLLATPAYAQEKKDRSESNIPFLVLDLDGDGIELTSLNSANAVYWDIDNDKFAEASAWVSPDDGLLVLDRNGDYCIKTHEELFGSAEQNGFEILAQRDDNGDKKIDASDEVWQYLAIWQDKDTNGFCQQKELFAIKDSNILAIEIEDFPTEEVREGNKITREAYYHANYATLDGMGTARRKIVNAYPRYTNVNTIYNDKYALDIRVAFLPTLRGFGNIPDLHIAMSIDNQGEEGLLFLVKRLHFVPIEQLFDPNRDIEGEIENILFRWSDAQNIDPKSRGPHIDARRLGVLEKNMGRKFIQLGAGGIPNPLYFAAINLNQAYLVLFNNTSSLLLGQGPAGRLFNGKMQYDLRQSRLIGITSLNHNTLQKIKNIIDSASDMEKRTHGWKRVVRLIEFTAGVDKLPELDQAELNYAIESSTQKQQNLYTILEAIKTYVPAEEYAKHAMSDQLYKSTYKRFNGGQIAIFFAVAIFLTLTFIFSGVISRSIRSIRKKK